jgi:hypothetical protein
MIIYPTDDNPFDMAVVMGAWYSSLDNLKAIRHTKD